MTTTERCINCDGLGWVGLATGRIPCPVCDTKGCVPSLGPVLSLVLPPAHQSINREAAALNEVARLAAECSRLRIENDAIQGAFGELIDRQRKAEAERDALKAAPALTGWVRVGDWAWANPDGRMLGARDDAWMAETADAAWFGDTAIDAARAAGWHDFPGVGVEVPS